MQAFQCQQNLSKEYLCILDEIRSQICALIDSFNDASVKATIVSEKWGKFVRIKCPQNIRERLKNYIMDKLDIDWYYDMRNGSLDIIGDGRYIGLPELYAPLHY